MVDFYVFDLDGTLIDTIGGIALALNNTLEHFSYPYHYSDIEVKAMVGHGAKQLFKTGTKKDVININEYNYFNIQYVICQRIAKVFPKVEETLRLLNRKGARLLIYSNKPDGALQFLIKEKLPDIDFALIQGHTEDFKLKPDASFLLKKITELGLKGKEGYYVGDSAVDVATARNAHLKSIIVTYGYGNLVDIKNSKPNYIIDNFDTILKL
ncbi:MAG: HAD family hydrolase [Bacilli bacterium]